MTRKSLETVIVMSLDVAESVVASMNPESGGRRLSRTQQLARSNAIAAGILQVVLSKDGKSVLQALGDL